MKLIIGLGNPGSAYEKTRHNAGFMAVDRLHRRHTPAEPWRARFDGLCVEAVIVGERCLLLKPNTYMNLSGRSVAAALNFYKLDPTRDLLVIVDEVALPIGTIRLRAGGGSGGHNGLTDVQRALGTPEYPRLRIGIGPCPPVIALEDYVLGRFTDEQMAALAPAIDRAADATEAFVSSGLAQAMNRFNSGPEPAEKPAPKGRPPSLPNPAPSTESNSQKTLKPAELSRGDQQKQTKGE
ncbi:MAG: aminoacyl-tRNA hydrolase [Phycisphaeraceae bacterium]|nr:aminoacyl-tRNA hydrolase [Phycisphaeraceae bacterium]